MMLRGEQDGWCILRTSGGRTLALADYLNRTGLEAWTPRRTHRRPMPGKAAKVDGIRRTIEVDGPILPTFVFARATHLPALLHLLTSEAWSRPAFSIFRHAGRVPVIGDGSVQGLRAEEAASAASLQRQRDAETREEAEAIRIATIKSEQARRRAARQAEHERRIALRAETRSLSPGDRVDIAEMPALTGLVGTVVEGTGKSALISFGGTLVMEIEAWRLLPRDQSLLRRCS